MRTGVSRVEPGRQAQSGQERACVSERVQQSLSRTTHSEYRRQKDEVVNSNCAALKSLSSGTVAHADRLIKIAIEYRLTNAPLSLVAATKAGGSMCEF